MEVQETGTGDLDRADDVGGGKTFDDRIRQRTRVAAGAGDQRDVRRPIAVVLAPRAFEVGFGYVSLEQTVGFGPVESLGHERTKERCYLRHQRASRLITATNSDGSKGLVRYSDTPLTVPRSMSASCALADRKMIGVSLVLSFSLIFSQAS